MQGLLFVVAAASGTGKTSLIKALLQDTPDLHVSVSHTTRSARPNEIDGTHYHFVTVEAFKDSVWNGEFIEHAEVFGNYYGTSQHAVTAQLNSGRDVLLEIDWQGAAQVKRIFADAILIFIIPPTRAALRQRLSDRGQDSAAVIETRLAGAVEEIRQHVNFDYLVVNDDFATALTDMKAIVRTSRLTMAQQVVRQQNMLIALLQ